MKILVSLDRLNNQFREWSGRKQDTLVYRFALTGDGSDAETADVAGRPGWAWVRYDEKDDKASQVKNFRFPGIAQGVPVKVGKKYPTDRFYQILELNDELYYQHATEAAYAAYILPAHGETHTAGSGNDPAPITTGNVVNGLCHETDPETMSVTVEALRYDYAGTLTKWAGGDTDLTGYVPGTAGYRRYVVVCIDRSTNSLTVVQGTAAPIAAPVSLPTVPAGLIPLAAAELRNGMTEVDNDNITDYRIIFSAVGGYIQELTQSVALIEAEYDYAMTLHVVEG